MERDNPASRLYNLLLAGKKLNTATTCRQAWHKILDVPNDNHPLLMSRLGKVMALPEEIISRVGIYDASLSDVHGYWTKRLEMAFSNRKLDDKWNDFISVIDETTISNLKMVSSIIDKEEKRQVISNDKLVEMRNSMIDLKNEAIEVEMDESLKRYIIIYLQKIISAIDEYKVSGAEPIMNSIEATLGHAFFDEKYRENLKTDFGNKFLSSLSIAASVLTIIIGLPQLPDTLLSYLRLMEK